MAKARLEKLVSNTGDNIFKVSHERDEFGAICKHLREMRNGHSAGKIGFSP